MMDLLLKRVQMIIKSIAEVFKTMQWRTLIGLESYSNRMLFRLSTFIWAWTMHTPYIVRAFVQSFYRPLHKNIIYNHKVWDGQTPNDFKRGNLIEFVYKLGGIKQFSWHDEDDGRGYYIGYSDEDEI